MEKGNKRLAVLVGCNYPNTVNELHGCLNDVLTMRDVLVSRFGFEPANIELLTDAAPGSSLMPTGMNIMNSLQQMVDQAQPGDVLFFHYSGHGVRIPSNHGFKHDEAIVPCDFNLITDVDFRRLVNRLPVGASFTVFSDSCHSGGLIDKEKEQIGPYEAASSTLLPNARTKSIPLDSIITHLTSISGNQSSNIGVHLSEVFGNQSSEKNRLGQRELDPLGPLHPDSGILLSGCQANETSADMNPTVKGGKAYGAFSNAVQMVLKENGNKISNKELIIRTREVLQEQGFSNQHPCLYCSDQNANAPFLWQPEHEDIM